MLPKVRALRWPLLFKAAVVLLLGHGGVRGDDAYQYDDNGESEKNDDGTPTTNSQHGVWIFKLDGRGGEAGNSSSMTSVGENSAQWTATVYNGAKFGPGRVDAGPKALVLEGNSQYVKIDGGIQVGGGAFSFCAWAKWDAFEEYSRVVDVGGSSNSDIIALYNNAATNTLAWNVYNGRTSQSFLVEAVLELREWVHICATVEASGDMHVYVDGAEQMCTSGTACDTATGKGSKGKAPTRLPRPFAFIGRSNRDNRPHFKGAISDVRFVDGSAVTADEVVEIMEATNPTMVATTTTAASNTAAKSNTTTAPLATTTTAAGTTAAATIKGGTVDTTTIAAGNAAITFTTTTTETDGIDDGDGNTDYDNNLLNNDDGSGESPATNDDHDHASTGDSAGNSGADAADGAADDAVDATFVYGYDDVFNNDNGQGKPTASVTATTATVLPAKTAIAPDFDGATPGVVVDSTSDTPKASSGPVNRRSKATTSVVVVVVLLLLALATGCWWYFVGQHRSRMSQLVVNEGDFGNESIEMMNNPMPAAVAARASASVSGENTAEVRAAELEAENAMLRKALSLAQDGDGRAAPDAVVAASAAPGTAAALGAGNTPTIVQVYGDAQNSDDDDDDSGANGNTSSVGACAEHSDADASYGTLQVSTPTMSGAAGRDEDSYGTKQEFTFVSNETDADSVATPLTENRHSVLTSGYELTELQRTIRSNYELASATPEGGNAAGAVIPSSAYEDSGRSSAHVVAVGAYEVAVTDDESTQVGGGGNAYEVAISDNIIHASPFKADGPSRPHQFTERTPNPLYQSASFRPPNPYASSAVGQPPTNRTNNVYNTSNSAATERPTTNNAYDTSDGGGGGSGAHIPRQPSNPDYAADYATIDGDAAYLTGGAGFVRQPSGVYATIDTIKPPKSSSSSIDDRVAAGIGVGNLGQHAGGNTSAYDNTKITNTRGANNTYDTNNAVAAPATTSVTTGAYDNTKITNTRGANNTYDTNNADAVGRPKIQYATAADEEVGGNYASPNELYHPTQPVAVGHDYAAAVVSPSTNYADIGDDIGILLQAGKPNVLEGGAVGADHGSEHRHVYIPTKIGNVPIGSRPPQSVQLYALPFDDGAGNGGAMIGGEALYMAGPGSSL